MSDENEALGKKTCRLCAEDHEVTLTLYSKEADEMLLQEKMSKYLLIELIEDDILPKNICLQCCTKLHKLCTFVEEVRRAQLFLSKETKNNQRDEENKPTTVNLTADIDDVSPNNMDTTDDPATLSVITSDNGHQDGETKTNKKLRKTFKCESCQRSFMTDIALKSHLWTHNIAQMEIKEELEPVKEDGTPVVPTNERLQCPRCTRRFLNHRTYSEHLSLHLSGNIYTCEVCSRVYRNLSSLNAHSLTHSDVKAYSCSMCPKKFKRKKELEVHVNQHTGKRPYKCSQCDHSFASASNRHSHRKRNHPKIVTRKPSHKLIDKQTETEVEGPSRKMNCNQVNDTGLPKYQCKHCTHGVNTSKNYMSHMFKHTAKNKFSCSLCPAEFFTKKGQTIHSLLRGDDDD